VPSLTRLSGAELTMTVSEVSAFAAATIGFRYPSAAIGTPMLLGMKAPEEVLLVFFSRYFQSQDWQMNAKAALAAGDRTTTVDLLKKAVN